MTVANHGFPFSSEVYHPTEEGGFRIGDVVDFRPERDVAFMKLTPSESHKSTNRLYFQAEKPIRLVLEDEIAQGSWSEVMEELGLGQFVIRRNGSIQAGTTARASRYSTLSVEKQHTLTGIWSCE